MLAKDICVTAAKLISGDRKQQHGPDMKESFQRTANLWSNYLGYKIKAKDVPIMMVLLKVTRAKDGAFNQDDYVDMCGYSAIAGQIDSD